MPAPLPIAGDTGTAWDPETSGIPWDPETSGVTWDPEHTGAPATPVQTLHTLAPIVAQPKADPKDDAAYLKAYQDYYNQNPTADRVGTLMREAGRMATSPLQTAQTLGPALWNAAKSVGKQVAFTAQDLAALPSPGSLFVGDRTAPYQPTNPNDTTWKDVAALGSGLVAGAGKSLNAGMDLLGAAGDQWNNMMADITANPDFREEAAQNALQRLKGDNWIAGVTANTETTPATHALNSLGQIIGAVAVPVDLGAAGAAGDAIKLGGDFLENGAYKLVGKGMSMAPAMGQAGAVAAEAMGAYHAPLKAIGVGVGGLMDSSGAAPMGSALNPYNWFTGLGAVKSGMFSAIGDLGERVAATPVGQNAIDSLVSNAPAIIQDANQKNLMTRAAVKQAQEAFNQSEAFGQSTIPAAKLLRQARQAATAANVNSYLVEKGTGVARWLQTQGANSITPSLASAFSGAVQGSLLGGSIAAMNGQPGDNSGIVNGISRGAFYGGLLSQLGLAGSSAEEKAASGALVPTPNPVPGATGPVNMLGQPASLKGFPAAPSSLRQAATEAATNTFVVGGKPHDLTEMAESLKDTGQQFQAAASAEDPSKSFKIGLEGTVDEFSHPVPSMRPDDETIQRVTATHVPVNSAPILSVGYLPEKNLASVRFMNSGAKGTQQYLYHDVEPDVYASWMKAAETDGSIGKYFNKYIKGDYPQWRVRDNLFARDGTPAVNGPLKLNDPAPGPGTQ